MKIQKNSSFHYDLHLPSSKSFINRALILAALTPESVKIERVTESTDILDLLILLEQIGLHITKTVRANGFDVVIDNSFPFCERESQDTVFLESGEGGTTNRFILPLLALGKNRYQLKPAKRLVERPMSTMWELLTQCGVVIEQSDQDWPSIQGPMHIKKKLVINSSQTTQIASAFAMAFFDHEQNIEVVQSSLSSGYFAMTKELIRRFQNGERSFVAPLDFSSVGYLVAYGVHINSIAIPGIIALDPFQPDSQLIKLVRGWGVQVGFKCSGMNVKPTPIDGFQLDCSSFPDLVPTLAFIAAYAKGPSELSHISNLRLKESDRIETLLELLTSFQVNAVYNEAQDTLTIHPQTQIVKESILYRAPNDHRLAMTAMLFMMKNSGGEIIGFECVRKSFPELLNEGALLPPR